MVRSDDVARCVDENAASETPRQVVGVGRIKAFQGEAIGIEKLTLQIE